MNFFLIQKNHHKIIINILGIKISFMAKKRKFIKNVFKTNFTKTVLIVYVIEPFLGNHYYSHSNATESYIAAEIFSELGYNVDVLNWTESKNNEFYSQYDVVYGKTLDSALFSKAKVIPYSGGTAHKNYNKESVLRAYEFYKKTGNVPNKSMCDCGNFSLAFAYANILLGNQIIKDSFKIDGLEQKLFNLDGFYFDVYDIDLEIKNFNEAKKHFLWWGSRGAIHKGLDIILDIFKTREDIILHICGFQESETDFFEYYHKELSNQVSNIINHGFVDIKSEQFRNIMNTCSVVVSPSISEGGAIGVLNVIANGGLIPMISQSSGLDVEQYGFTFEEINKESVHSQINKFLKLHPEEVKNLSKQIKAETGNRYSIENYRRRLTEILKEILSE